MTHDPITILIAEDVDLVAEAFEVLLSIEDDLEVVGRVDRGDAVLEAVGRLRPQVAILDVDMPGATGLEATAQLRDAGSDVKILLLTALPGSGHIPRALAAGANGYLVKSTTGQRLVEAIHVIVEGGTAIDPQLAADALRKGPTPLTERETELLTLVAKGVGTDDLADQLFLSKGTVRNYLSSAMAKLQASNRTEAVAKAKEQGWI
ncbi:response regulator [Flexivirga caeni]|uniref:DNA-binding response regulator n=1 Tax=Flexivirga caeni TaxID=2294115 RepID=A0A3M9M985_9MICO|nr:response regulator transcription factor [Flexivirga caeni]RNI21118.1 DNA-binding response regulator [Flexivirga caeni]